MPWHIVKDHAECGAGKWAVVKDQDGDVEGCHMSEAAAKRQLAALYANEPGMHSAGSNGDERAVDQGNISTPNAADLDTAARKYAASRGWAMPDGAYPIRPLNMHGRADLIKAVRAVGRGGGSHDAIRRHIIKRARALGLSDLVPDNWSVDGNINARPDVASMCVRAFDFESRSNGDGRILEGYAAVFNQTIRIPALGGDFDEKILPGAFKRSLETRTPVLQFEHGRDPRVGAVPIGSIQDIHEDSQGLYVRAQLFDNATVEPVRQAISGRAIRGMSFRFSIPDGGDTWMRRSGDVDLREIIDTDTAECGPVVFPAYDQTTVLVRSLLAQLDPSEHRTLLRELAVELGLAAEPVDLTGRSDARSTDGGDSGDGSSSGASPIVPTHRQRLDHGALQIRRILR